MEVRGEIFTVPVDKGDIRNITNSTAVNERDPHGARMVNGSPISATKPGSTH